MNTFLQDLKYGFRLLGSNRIVTAVALLTLALGIGVNTALFSVLYAVLWKPLPYTDPDRLAIVWETNANSGETQNVVNPANYADWKEQNGVFTDMAAFITMTVNLTGDGTPEEVPIQWTTPNLFSVLGVRPILGRNFSAGDGVGDDNVVMLSFRLWQRRYNSDRSIAGKQILVNGRKATVAGVMPENFAWFIKPSITGKPPQLWGAYPITPEINVRHGRYFTTVARLKKGVTLEQAKKNMSLISRRLENEYHNFDAGWGSNVVSLRRQLSGNLQKPLFVLAAAVCFVLLIACTNVANLMLSRSVSRNREMAVRSALGAGRSRILRQIMTESILLAVLGGALGTLIAAWGTQMLALIGERAGIDFTSVTVNMPVLLFALAVSILTGLIFGIAPSMVATRWNLKDQIIEGGRTGTELHGRKLRNILVGVQLSVALLLLAGASLMIQSYWRLTSVNPGFHADHVLTLRLLLSRVTYPEDSQRIEMFQSVLSRLQSLPGVKSAGMINYLPFAGPAAGTSFTIEGEADRPAGQSRLTKVFVVDNGFFKTLQIPLKQGRFFTNSEMREQKHVVLISEAFAAQHFPNQNPLGRNITVNMKNPNVPTRIIGIVGDVKNERLDSEANPSVYWPHPELAYAFMTFVVRVDKRPLSLSSSAVTAVHDIDPEQPVADIRTLESWLDDSTAGAEFSTSLLAILAVVALILAATGVFAVMSHAVVQRTREMGIRMALGARSQDVAAMVLKEGGRILLIGSVIGCALAIALTHFLQSMLYETNALNIGSLLLVTVLLMASGLIACWIPSRRAARVNPIEALRYE